MTQYFVNPRATIDLELNSNVTEEQIKKLLKIFKYHFHLNHYDYYESVDNVDIDHLTAELSYVILFDICNYPNKDDFEKVMLEKITDVNMFSSSSVKDYLPSSNNKAKEYWDQKQQEVGIPIQGHDDIRPPFDKKQLKEFINSLDQSFVFAFIESGVSQYFEKGWYEVTRGPKNGGFYQKLTPYLLVNEQLQRNVLASCLTIAKLKKLLKEYGLKVSGTKETLTDRLLETDVDNKSLANELEKHNYFMFDQSVYDRRTLDTMMHVKYYLDEKVSFICRFIEKSNKSKSQVDIKVSPQQQISENLFSNLLYEGIDWEQLDEDEVRKIKHFPCDATVYYINDYNTYVVLSSSEIWDIIEKLKVEMDEDVYYGHLYIEAKSLYLTWFDRQFFDYIVEDNE